MQAAIPEALSSIKIEVARNRCASEPPHLSRGLNPRKPSEVPQLQGRLCFLIDGGRKVILQRGRRHSHRHDHLANRPQREPGKLEMRPRERDTDDGDGEEKRGDNMGER
jgi:hypothetical protein